MRVLVYYTCLFITMNLLIGCVSAPRFTFAKYQSGIGEGTYSIYEEGMASYYADEFHGRTTSNGETFDMNQLTAAHRTLPFNTKVLVTNTLNGKAVTVRINDRGPFVDDRIIDLSLAAARAIDLVGPGTAKVKLQVVELGANKPSIKP
ncbi:MAG TPA: septal ring lytic transglycosylase RlpA family protein [Bacteroidota bacterium]|nr:septal ring lytic transglycosylase RlpA family protein [Bacteroidota bacterium]